MNHSRIQEDNPDLPLASTGELPNYGVTISPTPPNGITVVMRWSAVGTMVETFSQGSTGTIDILVVAQSME